MRRALSRARGKSLGNGPDGDHGSATIWTVALLGVLAALTAAVLLLTTAIGVRHKVERAADETALAAARAALSGLRFNGDPRKGEPCKAATRTATAYQVMLRACTCDALDCVVTVEGSFLDGTGLGGTNLGSLVGARIPVPATAQAGPVGESAEDDGVGLPIDGPAAAGSIAQVPTAVLPVADRHFRVRLSNRAGRDSGLYGI